MIRAVLTWLAQGVVALAAALLSFSALRDLAVLCGYGEHLAVLFPITIDAAAATCSAAWLSGHATILARRLTLGLLALSVALNAVLHVLTAYALAAPWWLVVLVGAIPPGVLGAVAHLYIRVLDERRAMHAVLSLDTLEEAEEAAGVPVIATRDIPTVLYRARDSDDALLYVGITSVPLPLRLARHRREKLWWSEVVRVDVEEHSCRRDALAAEVAAIASEHPKYNQQPGSLSDHVSPMETNPDADTDDEAERLVRARELVVAGAGRGTLMREFSLTDHQARLLLEKARQPAPVNGKKVLS